MSIMQRLTLIGLYNYDNTLFDGLTLPAAYDKSIFVESLMIEHGEKLVLYSDYDFMKYSIGAWGRKWSMELTRIAEALQAEYNPIWNYDRYEEWKDKGGKRGTSETDATHNEELNNAGSHIENGSSKTNTDSTSDSEGSRRSESASNTSGNSETSSDSSHVLKNTTNYTDKQTNDFDVTNSQVTNGSVEHQVSADNNSSYQPASQDLTSIGSTKEENDGTITHDITGEKDNITERTMNEGASSENATSASSESARDTSSTVNSGSEENKTEASGRTTSTTSSQGGSNTKTSDSEIKNSDHVGHLWGNIGVTTSAAMVTEVVEQRMKYNLYNVACRLFANELLIGIY